MSFALFGVGARIGIQIVVGLGTLLGLPAALVELPGIAEIASPEPLQNVSGIVSISRAANQPAFGSYGLTSGPEADASDAWGSNAGFVRFPFLDGRLGIWDMTRISDGSTRIRPLARLEGAGPLQDIAGGTLVRNDALTEVPTTVQTTASQPTVVPVDLQDAMAPRAVGAPKRFASALSVGVLGALAAMLALSAYGLLSPRVRAYLARMRTRRLYRNQDLTRKRGSNRG